MDMTGEQLIAAPRQKVWAALNDPEILRQSITGCESVVREGENTFLATVVAKVGPVKATFRGKVTLTDIDAPNGYRIIGEGQGGAAGFGKGGAKVTLSDAPGDQTLLRYEAQAQVGGKLAQLGSRLIDATARKLAEEFFVKFNEIVSAGAAPAPAPAEAAATTAPAPADEAPPRPATAPAAPQKGLPAWLWVGGAIVIVVALLWALTD